MTVDLNQIRIGDGGHLVKATAKDVDYRQIQNREVRQQVRDTFIAEFVKRAKLNLLDPRTENEMRLAGGLLFDQKAERGQILVDIRLK